MCHVAAQVALTTILARLASASGADSAATLVDQDELRAIVAEVLADSETRSSLADEGIAGHDGRFFLRSADGDFTLRVSGQMQFRYNLNVREEDDSVNQDEFESGFNNPRTRVAFHGNVQDKRLFYRVMLDFDPGNGNAVLQDAWAGYDFDSGWTLRWGQGITAFMREWYIGDWKLFSVERSLQSLVFGQFRSQFVDLKWRDENLRFIGTFSDGFRSANTQYTADPADWALTARAEWRFAGEWDQLTDEFRSPRGSGYAGSLGGALHYEQGPDTGASADEQGLFAWTADTLVKGDGWNCMLAGVGYHVQDEAGVAGADFEDFGLLAQAGFHVTEKLELVARYDVIMPDEDRAAGDDFNTIMGGFNYYFHGHAFKLNFAAMWFLDPTTETAAGNFANSGARNPTSPAFGVLPSAEEDQVTIMVQVQLLF